MYAKSISPQKISKTFVKYQFSVNREIDKTTKAPIIKYQSSILYCFSLKLTSSLKLINRYKLIRFLQLSFNYFRQH